MSRSSYTSSAPFVHVAFPVTVRNEFTGRPGMTGSAKSLGVGANGHVAPVGCGAGVGPPDVVSFDAGGGFRSSSAHADANADADARMPKMAPIRVHEAGVMASLA